MLATIVADIRRRFLKPHRRASPRHQAAARALLPIELLMRVSHLAAVAALLLPLCALAGIESITASDSVAALKTALNQGTTHAIESLGVVDGFLKNPAVKIPLPPTLQKAESVMRLFGMGEQADALVVAMNRAAEAAVPEAKSLLVGAVQQMSLVDARQILTGGDNAAHQYFPRCRRDRSNRHSCRS
jgi:hypothetical protein